MFQLPLKHYHGIRIGIDLDCMHNPLMTYAASCGCSPLEALRHICGGMSHIVLRSSDAAKKFFNGLYEAEFDQRLDYLRVKMPELFYRMKYAKTDSSYYDRNLVPRAQVEIVKSVSECPNFFPSIGIDAVIKLYQFTQCQPCINSLIAVK